MGDIYLYCFDIFADVCEMVYNDEVSCNQSKWQEVNNMLQPLSNMCC